MPAFSRALGRAFSRALGIVVGFTLSSHWLLKIFSFLPTGCCDNFGFINFQIEAGGGAETVIEQLKQEKVHFVHVHRYHFHDYKYS